MGGYDLNGKYVLIIEDNAGDARLIEILLKESELSSCTILKEANLESGFKVLESDKDFAAILLDLSLPDSMGLKTLELLLEKYPHNNVIVLTGQSDKELGLKAVQAGAQDFLDKGNLDSDTLAKSLRFSMERNAILSRLEETQRIAKLGHWEYHQVNDVLQASDEVFYLFDLIPEKSDPIFLNFLQKEHPFQLFSQFINEANEKGFLKKDVHLPAKDGKSEKVLFVRCSAKGDEGRKVFQGIIQDVTERKFAKREYAKSKERYLQIFTQSRDAIYIGSLSGKLVDCNQATSDLLQVDKELLLQTENIHHYLTPLERTNEFLLKLRYQRSVRDFEIEVKRKDGEIRSCLISANLQKEDNFEGYSAIIRDITERKQTEQLIKARDIADQSTQLREQFIASISHEMRTPMNAILGMSNLLDNTSLDGEQKELVSSIKQSSEVLLGIVNDILEIATIQNGKITFENEPFNLHEVLYNLVNVMQYKAREKNLEFKLDIEKDIPQEILGDKLRLNQIMFNLVGNAIKFTDEGKVCIKVEKLTDFEGGIHLRFQVEDTGIGIPPEKIDAVFESFTRIRQKDRVFEGTGLGLSIAKSLVEQQGGKIGAQSEVGQGSRFYFDLIFETREESDDKGQEEDKTILRQAKTHKILLVEDHKMNQLVAKKTLTKKWENVEVSIAENGEEAIQILENERFDLILMDVQMPVMDGYQATSHIRNKMSPELAEIPILAMTAHAHLSKDGNFKKYGMDDFVLKPFQPEELFTKIAEYLNK